MLRPRVLVCLGATAARAILGSSFRVTKERGTPLPCPDLAYGSDQADLETARPEAVVATLHPAAVLRADDRDAAYQGLVADLGVAADV